MHICKYVFLENCTLQGYYVASSVKNARYLVTLKSAVLIYFASEASNRAFVGLSVMLGYQTMKIMSIFWS